MAGKGSNPRPFSVDQKTFSDNWDKIFKKSPVKVNPKSLDQEAFGPVSEHPDCGTDDCCGECTE